jgi:hypothetical protein
MFAGMNSLRYPPEEPPRPNPEDLFRRELRALDTYKVPDYATGALPLSPLGMGGLGAGAIGLALALFPWVGLYLGAPLGLLAVVMAIWAGRRIRRGRERGAGWAAAAAALGAVAMAVGVLLNVEHPFKP